MNKKIFALLLACLILTSCKGLIYDIVIGKPNIKEEIKILENTKNNKTIVFFPMVHIGKKEYYETSKLIIDSLRSEGFIFYY